MAATFVVEDGTGMTNANSYVAVTNADQYHLDHSASTTWSGASTANKEKALRLATQYADARHNGRWRGYKYTEAQALAWPRTLGADDEGFYYDVDEIPQCLQDAVCELALRVIDGDTLLDDQAKPGVISSTSVSVGPISKSVTYQGGLLNYKKYPLIEALFAPLIAKAGVLERG